MSDFDPKFFNSLCDSIKKALDDGANPIASFDADGTLWSGDAGLDFYKYQIENNLLSGLPDNPWDAYIKYVTEKEDEALLWLAQINKGQTLTQVRQWAEDYINKKTNLGYFSGVKKLITFLKDHGVDVYVVTASIKWSVEPAAIKHGIQPENVLGIQTKVIDNIITDVQDGPVTWHEGKVTKLLEVTNGQKPFLTAGNSKGDLALLESATDIRLVIQSAGKDHFNFETEKQMKALALERSWKHYSFL